MIFKAAVLETHNSPLTLRELVVPETLAAGQVLVRVHYAGICGAQIGEIQRRKGPDKFLPHLMGHEGGGVVVSTGPGVRHVKEGQHVVMHWRKGNGIDAEFAKYWCPQMDRFVGAGQVTTFNEYAVVSENRLTPIDDSVPLDLAALFGCAVTTGLGAVCRDLQMKIGESIAILGCGGVGMNIIQGAVLAGANPIIAIDITKGKLGRAKELGATHTINNADNRVLVENVLNILPQGVDNFIDTTGNKVLAQHAFRALTTNGKLLMVGQLHVNEELSIQPLPMHQGRQILGSDGGGTMPSVDIPRYIRLMQAGRLNLKKMITHTAPLHEINGLLDLVMGGKTGRAVISMV